MFLCKCKTRIFQASEAALTRIHCGVVADGWQLALKQRGLCIFLAFEVVRLVRIDLVLEYEDKGLVLAILPLVINQLDNYVQDPETIKSATAGTLKGDSLVLELN